MVEIKESSNLRLEDSAWLKTSTVLLVLGKNMESFSLIVLFVFIHHCIEFFLCCIDTFFPLKLVVKRRLDDL